MTFSRTCCWVALTAALVAFPAAAQQAGSADFTRYVAVGDSLTAGFSSGGLVETLQVNSYPALLSRHIRGESAPFEQPLVSEPGIPPLLELCSLTPLDISPKPGQGVPLNLNLPRPYDNLAVPGATLNDAVSTVTDNGGLHDLILRGLGTQLQQALALEPTFVTVWIGNNDVLGAAVSGIVIEGVTLTPLASFQADLDTLVDSLAASGASLAIANIPDVTAIPFVSTLPPVVLDPATGEPLLINGAPVPLFTAAGPLAPTDHVLLSASAYLAAGCGIPDTIDGGFNPFVCPDGALPDSAVLDTAETAQVQARTAEINAAIEAKAAEVGAALVDVASLFDEITAHGFDLGGIEYTTEFLTGGLFSYDGVHPTPLGYGIVANAFLRAINRTFGAAFAPVDLFDLAFSPGTGAPAGCIETSALQMRLTRESVANLWEVLSIPPEQDLLRMKAIHQRRAAPERRFLPRSRDLDDANGRPRPHRRAPRGGFRR